MKLIRLILVSATFAAVVALSNPTDAATIAFEAGNTKKGERAVVSDLAPELATFSEECLVNETRSGRGQIHIRPANECSQEPSELETFKWLTRTPSLLDAGATAVADTVTWNQCCQAIYEWCTTPAWGGCGASCRVTGTNTCTGRCLFCGSGAWTPE